ncbi:small ribosomal subunit protein uS9m [Bacillus rossius redtenbacheri]|uniref:small ribosomal subunit protein uS9m n=1 Tax=Bacillus rossius redtenbacheri TaxID=93214 RepID=UPI002FDCE3F8
MALVSRNFLKAVSKAGTFMNSETSLKCISSLTRFKAGQDVSTYSTKATTKGDESKILQDEPVLRQEKTSKAMRVYLERASKHDEFLKQQLTDYNIGKRHLANMMGEDPETFTQEDIDRAIQYLFPSGLFDPRARPLMKHPDVVFPKRKAAEFDESGRPFHFLFYTITPVYYQLFHDVACLLEELDDFEDTMIRKRLLPDPTQTLNLSGSQWATREQLEVILIEQVSERAYKNFVTVMERLCEHPYAYRVKDFIEKYRKPLISQATTLDIPKPQYDADGRSFVTIKECLRKRARGEVTMRSPGTGKVVINNRGIDYFEDDQPREQLLFPLIFTGMVGKVDVEATVDGGGPSGQAGALRWGIAMCLRSYVDKDTVEKMRIAGLLTRDYRKRERKKPGQPKARKKATWKKR